MKSVRWALLAAVVGLGLGTAEASDAAIFDYSYKLSTGSTFQALFDGTFRPDNNIFDIIGVNSVSVDGAAISGTFGIVPHFSSGPFVSLNGAAQEFYLTSYNGNEAFSSTVSLDQRIGATSLFGGTGLYEAYNPANFNGRAVGPGAPAPEIGVGLLSMLAAGLALAFTRFRRASMPLPA